MAGNKQISFRPDDSTRIALDWLADQKLHHDLEYDDGQKYCGALPYSPSTKSIISHLIWQEYLRVHESVSPSRLGIHAIEAALRRSKNDEWPTTVPATYVDLTEDQKTLWKEKQWKTFLDYRYGDPRGPAGGLPTTAKQLELAEVWECYKANLITDAMLKQFSGALNCTIYHDSKNGDIVKSYDTNIGTLEHVISQDLFTPDDDPLAGILPDSYYFRWRMKQGLPDNSPDLTQAELIHDIIDKAKGERIELFRLDGDIWERKTKVNRAGDAIERPVVNQISGKKPEPQKTSEADGKKLFADLRKSLEIEGDIQSKARFEYMAKHYKRAIMASAAKWGHDLPDFDQLYEKAKAAKSDDRWHQVFSSALPPRIVDTGTASISDQDRDAAIEQYINPSTNKHLTKFYELSENHIPQSNVGKSLYEFLTAVGVDDDPYWEDGDGGIAPWVRQPMNRKQLLKLCSSDGKGLPTRYCFLAILAFMAHRIDHVKSAWALIDSIEPILDQIRTKKEMSRQKAYEQLWRHRAVDMLPGLRPATYCSLIYFLRPKQDGYMMSTHTAKSINLIASQEIVILNKSNYPTDDNNSARYEAYCQIIDAIGRNTPGGQMAGGDVEERLQSEDEPLGEWREYLQNHEVG